MTLFKCIVGFLFFLLISCDREKEEDIININQEENYAFKGWDVERLGTETDALFYTDGNANYWGYTFDTDDLPDDCILKIKGCFPYAHYMSYNLYDANNFKTLGSLYDVNIQRENNEGKINWGEDVYTISIAKEETYVHGESNLLIIPEGTEQVSIILRYYLAQEIYGKVEIPEIIMWNLIKNTQQVIPVSTYHSSEMSSITAAALSIPYSYYFKNVNRDGDLLSFRFGGGGGGFANADNEYLMMPFQLEADEVALIRFIPPVPAESMNDSKSDVRYWSISLGDDGTRNQKTKYHKEFQIAEDGYVYLAITSIQVDEPLLTSEKWNFMTWPADKNLMLVYRNLLSNENYPYHFENVYAQELWKLQPNTSKSADQYIGERALLGEIVNRKDFLDQGKSLVWE